MLVTFPLSLFQAVLSENISSLLFVPLVTCAAATSFCTFVAAKKTHCTPCLACAALNYLSAVPLAAKTDLSSALKSCGKDIHQHRPVFPLGVCPLWCLLLSLIDSYSSKSCQGSLEFFLRCIFSRIPRRSRDRH